MTLYCKNDCHHYQLGCEERPCEGEVNMDFINLGGNKVRDGLGLMLESVLGEHGHTDTTLVEVPIALLIIEIAKVAEDKEEWFPCGKWATIQAIQARIANQIQTLFKGRVKPDHGM